MTPTADRIARLRGAISNSYAIIEFDDVLALCDEYETLADAVSGWRQYENTAWAVPYPNFFEINDRLHRERIDAALGLEWPGWEDA